MECASATLSRSFGQRGVVVDITLEHAQPSQQAFLFIDQWMGHVLFVNTPPDWEPGLLFERPILRKCAVFDPLDDAPQPLAFRFLFFSARAASDLLAVLA